MRDFRTSDEQFISIPVCERRNQERIDVITS